MKIQFGSGGNILPGWHNTDMGWADPKLKVDITKPLPFADGIAEMVLAEHVCEHVTGPQFLSFLRECRRILKPGGKIRICMPVLEGLDHDQRIDIIMNHGHLAAYTVELIRLYIGVAGFNYIVQAMRDETIDGHWREIGRVRDFEETARFEAIK